MRVRAAVAALLLVTGVCSATLARADVANPIEGPFPQATGEMVTDIPDTPACTTTIVKDKPFNNGYADQSNPDNRPFVGTYTPTCTGPWSKVVLTMSAYVDPGTQFDRLGEVLIGGAQFLHLSTPEGTFGRTSWQVQRDVSDYASLLTSQQPVYFIIGNVTDGTYTGIFYGTLSLTFYGTSAKYTALKAADQVIGLGLGDTDHAHRYSRQATFPQNMTNLSIDVYSSGHGWAEEFWWTGNYNCDGRPYRELAVYVDGQLAGAAPPFPTLFSGGFGPDMWRPIPSPRTFNLRPYRLDLTPFVGLLTDGQSHTIEVGLLNQDPSCGGHWETSANLLVDVNHANQGRTLGDLVSTNTPPLPTNTGPIATKVQLASSHALSITGWTRPAGGPLTTTTVAEQLNNHGTPFGYWPAVDWTWSNSTTTKADGHSTVRSSESTYQLYHDFAKWSFVDKEDRSVLRDGAQVSWSRLDDRMNSLAPPGVGTLGAGGGSAESWIYSNSSGTCVNHQLASAVQNIVLDKVTDICPSESLPVPALPLLPAG